MSAADVSTPPVIYTASRIAAVLARRKFDGALCVVDECGELNGSRCDLLVVSRNLRAIDVEIKIDRADVRRDRKKDKWFSVGRERDERGRLIQTPREWPRNVWKHYYVVAAPIWSDDLLEHCQPRSGVVVIDLSGFTPKAFQARWSGGLTVKRRAQANPDNKPLDHDSVINIARLASVRMWDAYEELDRRTTA